jgi:hypothetical protein
MPDLLVLPRVGEGKPGAEEVSKLVMVPGPLTSIQFAAIERDDGTLVFATDYVGKGRPESATFDGKRMAFVNKADFADELAAAGLQPVWMGATR